MENPFVRYVEMMHEAAKSRGEGRQIGQPEGVREGVVARHAILEAQKFTEQALPANHEVSQIQASLRRISTLSKRRLASACRLAHGW